MITGCSSGIGYHCATQLKTRGWRVIATARGPSDLERLRQEGFQTVRLDYADPQSIADAADTVAELTGGKLYALFNNGAYAQKGALEDIPVELLRQQFETNVIGWHDLTRRLLPLLRANGEGRIVQMSSFLGQVALRWRGAYTASKYAVEALSDTLRLELRGTGIHVSIIQPGPIESRFHESAENRFHDCVDVENSKFKDAYGPLFKRLKKGHDSPLTRSPEAVFRKLLHALESRRPRARYQVTLATPLFFGLKRLLPQPLFDRFLYWASDQ